MADILKLRPIILKWEGDFVNDKYDRGGATMKGITLSTFQYYYGKNKTADDLRKITDAQWLYIFRRGYWNVFKADKIKNQSIANILVDFGWASGSITAIKKIQRAFALNSDGVVGEKTLAVLNGANGARIFETIKNVRLQFVQAICVRNTTQERFLRGWKNRINYFKYEE